MTLAISNLSKSVDHLSVFKDISFEVQRGEILGVFGESIAGNSSLIRAIAGVIDCDSGEIRFNGKDLTRTSFEDRGFCLPLVENSKSWSSFLKPQTSSKSPNGDTQTAAFESALDKAETVMLLDNQFCCLDIAARDKNIAKLKSAVKEKELAVVFATNNFEEIFMVCDRVLIMHEGRILQIGFPREIYESPLTVAAAQVTGRNNIIRSQRVSSSKSETPQFVTIDGEHRLFTKKIKKSDLAAINQDMFLAIRPEHISISFGASFPADNLLKAVITEINYLGAFTLLNLNADGLALNALVLRLVGLNVGDECMVGLPPDRILVLKN